MAWIVKDFVCPNCGHEFEELFKVGDEDNIPCPECGHSPVESVLSSPALGKFSMADRETKTEILKKRSFEHTKKEVIRNAEKFGDAGLAERKKYLGN